MKRTVITFILAVILVFPPILSNVAEANITSEPQIAVRLSNFLGNQEAVTFAVTGEYLISADNRALEQNVNFTVRIENAEIVLFSGSERLARGETLTVRPVRYSQNSFITIRGPNVTLDYLGEITFTIENGRFIRPINRLLLEDYLLGVVPREMPASWPLEALKAQAVAARTYALRRRNQVIGDTQQFQVYGGFPREPITSRTSRAVAETRGQVLFFNNALAETLYSSSNGGMTESGVNAWGGKQHPYLLSQEDPFDPRRSWCVSLYRQQIDLSNRDLTDPGLWWSGVSERDERITNRLKAWLARNVNCFVDMELKIVSIPNLQVAEERNSSGRSRRWSVTLEIMSRRADGTFVMENGNVKITRSVHSDIPIATLRAILGTMQAKSLLIDNLYEYDTHYRLTGRGFGHGVGMSQYGARMRAYAGHSFAEILNFYYPGTVLTSLPWASSPPSPIENIPVPTPPMIFDDIQGHWAQEEIMLMTDLGVVGGVAANSFSPNEVVTRAQFAAFLIRSLGIAEAPLDRFSDVRPGAWYYGAVGAAQAAELVGGYPDGSFRPNQPITRQEIAVMVVRALPRQTVTPIANPPEGVLAAFADESFIATWAREATAQAVAADIVRGRGENRFAPLENANRAEAVVMLKRMLLRTGQLIQQ